MSRSIIVSVAPAKIFADRTLSKEQQAWLPLFREALIEARVLPEDKSIYTQPGSHPGIRCLQEAWAHGRGYKTLRKVPADVYETNHLLNLCAYGSYCRPRDFKIPKVKNEMPICSSPRLLRELLELDRTALKEEELFPYWALLAGTLGSVLGNVEMSIS